MKTTLAHPPKNEWRLAAFFIMSALLSACASTSWGAAPAVTPPDTDQFLHQGDVIKIAFPAAANLDTTQQIRRDGNINLYMVGEIKAAGRTPANLQRELQQLYSKELISGDVVVTIVSSTFSVFVAGAVVRPGKILPERSITVLEAIMEAGGFDREKANLKSVVVIRTEDGVTQNFTVDAKAVLSGKPVKPFFLKSHDIVFVPERFSFF
jgi:polysaccharide biosynthesis/export protein